MDLTDVAAALLEPVPANRAFGIRVVRAADCAAEVEVELDAAFANVIGSMHSSGLIALIDATGLAALIAAAPDRDAFDGVVPLGTRAELHFSSPARGRLTGRCRLSPPDRDAVRTVLERHSDRARAMTEVTVHDEENAVVCRGAFQWAIRRVPVSA